MTRKNPSTTLIARGLLGLTGVLLFHLLWTLSCGARYSHYTVATVVVELIFTLLAASTYLDVLRASRSNRMFVRLFLWMLAIVTLGMLGDVFAWGLGMEHFFWAPITYSPIVCGDAAGR